MTHSTLWLAQIQFFSSVGFMLLFLVLEFGLAWVLLYFRIRAIWSADPAVWVAAYRFWVRVFALAFILSFAAGMPVLIQFGSLWPHLMDRIGDVASPLLAAIILSMFIFKSCFLGVMLFGARRVPDVVHTIMVAMVAIGVSVSTFFLLALISWTHTPAGAILINGRYIVESALHVVFNPALLWYGALFVAVSMLSVAFLMMAVVAGQAMRSPVADAPSVFRTALLLAGAGVVLHVFALHGTVQLAAQYQPAKAAAIAAYWHSGLTPELLVAGWPDVTTATNRFAWGWPGYGASWLGVDNHGHLRGLDQFSGMMPPVVLTFWSFRVAGVAALLMGMLVCLLMVRLFRHGYDPAVLPKYWLYALKAAAVLCAVMVLANMAHVQVGAFPYAVYETVTLSEVVTSASFFTLKGIGFLYAVCYVALLAGFLYLLRYISRYGVIPVTRRRRRA